MSLGLAMLLAAAAPAPPEPGPGDTVRLYYRDLAQHRYRAAWRLWAREGQASGASLVAFRAGFANTRSTAVRVAGPVASEGAAGSIWATVPVEVDATTRAGRRQRFRGTYTLRRVNDVDGSTAQQRRWHIERATLKSVR